MSTLMITWVIVYIITNVGWAIAYSRKAEEARHAKNMLDIVRKDRNDWMERESDLRKRSSAYTKYEVADWLEAQRDFSYNYNLAARFLSDHP